MVTYIESNLIKDEQVKYEGKTSVWSLLPKILLGLILILLHFHGIGILGGLLLWIAAAISYYTTELAITNKRVIAKFGFIRRNTVEINIQKVESILVDQGILGRFFNFGSVVVSGAGDQKAPIPGISDPLKFRKIFFEVQEGVKEGLAE